MKRWNFIIGAVLVVLGVFALLQVLLDVVGIHFRIGSLFWPLILIGIGVWIVMGFSRGSSSRAPREQASVPLDGAAEAAVTVRHGAGRLTIGPGTAGDQLLNGSFGGGLATTKSMDGKRLRMEMSVRDRDVSHYIFGPWHRGWAGTLDWDFTLNPSVPLSLRLETGASESRLSLGDLQVRELVLKTGASSTTIDLPRAAGHTLASVESGAASVRIRVPQGVAASISVKSALAGIHVDTARFPRSGSGYLSTDYDKAENKVEIMVETGVGSIEIT
jgi:predicted membrane protein